MSHTEADRKAYNKDVEQEQRAKEVADWLAANPQVGVLQKGSEQKFYVTDNGNPLYIHALVNPVTGLHWKDGNDGA